MKPPKWEVALDLSTSKTELDTKDVMLLFDIKKAAAQNYKSKVLKEQAKREVKTWYSGHINLTVAYEFWGIDIVEIEKKLKKREALKNLIRSDTNDNNPRKPR